MKSHCNFCRWHSAFPAQIDSYGSWSVWGLFPKQCTLSRPLKNGTPVSPIKCWPNSFSGIPLGHFLGAEFSSSWSWSTAWSHNNVSRNRAHVFSENTFVTKNEKEPEKEIQTGYEKNQWNITMKESLLVFFKCNIWKSCSAAVLSTIDINFMHKGSIKMVLN